VVVAYAMRGLFVFGRSECLGQSLSLHHGDVQNFRDDDFPVRGLPPVDVVLFASGEKAIDFELVRDGPPHKGLVGDLFEPVVQFVEVGVCLPGALLHQCVFVHFEQGCLGVAGQVPTDHFCFLFFRANFLMSFALTGS